MSIKKINMLWIIYKNRHNFKISVVVVNLRSATWQLQELHSLQNAIRL